ncbi:MAG: hypothetical protein FJX75_29380, partial [Armatimonadetes bacterium]|nr:hypothetical protein [Armatimonadota bacterium]
MMPGGGEVMTHAQLIAVSVLGMLTVPSTGVAATRNVPAQYRSIQAAISAATNGDEVVVATGTYRENINFRGKSITVRSTDPSDPAVVATTIIDGSSREAPVVMFDSGEGKRSILDGFTITGGTGWYHDGGGVYCRKSSPVVRRNVITRNSVVADGLGGGDGGGVYCAFGSSAIIEGNTISGNTASVYGGGISAYESSPTIRGNTITNNRAGDRPLSGWGGGISALWDAKIERNLVSGNHAGGGGGGISGGSLVVGNTITGNTCGGDGGGIRCGPATIEGNMIADNRAIDGGGIWCSGPSTIKGNTIADNRATDGGGVYCFYLRPPDPVPLARGATHAASYPIEGPVIQGNVISRNTAIYWGGGVLCHASPAVLLNDTIVGNHARMGGGVYCIADTYWDDPVIAAIRNCIIAYTTRGGGIVAEGGNAYRLLGERVSYCDLYANTGGNYHPFVLTGRGNLSLDPMFADAANGDFHLKSLGGRRTPDGWVVDTVHSPCIDAGDPAADYSLEPHPNGNRANLGFEGGTAQASRSHWLPTQPDMLIRNAGEAQFIGN